MMKLASNLVLQEEYNYFYPKEELIILLTWWLPPLIKGIHSKSIFSRLSRLGRDPSISFKFGPTMKMKDEHSLITPRVSRQSSTSKSQPTNFTYSLRVFFSTSQVQQHGWNTRTRVRAYRAHGPTLADSVSSKDTQPERKNVTEQFV